MRFKVYFILSKISMLYINNIFLGCTFTKGFNPLSALMSPLSLISFTLPFGETEFSIPFTLYAKYHPTTNNAEVVRKNNFLKIPSKIKNV